MRSVLASVFVSGVLSAQSAAPAAPRIDPEQCFPDGHTLFVRANLTELCASPWWAALKDQPLVADFRRRFESRTGVALQRLARVTLAGSSQDWSRLCAVLESHEALDPRAVAAAFQGRAPNADAEEQHAGRTLILPPARAAAAPAVLELRQGVVVLGSAPSLRAASGREPGRPAELLDAVMLAQDSTLVAGTSHEEPLLDVSRWLDPGHGTELLGASCALVVGRAPCLELRVRCLEHDAAAPLERRLRRRLTALAKDLERSARPVCARLIGEVELETRGAEVRARLQLLPQDEALRSPAALVAELLGRPAAAPTPQAPQAPAPGR